MRLEEPELINYEDEDLDEEHMDSLVDLGGVDYGDEILDLLRAMLSTDPNNRKFSCTCMYREGAGTWLRSVLVILRTAWSPSRTVLSAVTDTVAVPNLTNPC
jgi:hypothetical protein